MRRWSENEKETRFLMMMMMMSCNVPISPSKRCVQWLQNSHHIAGKMKITICFCCCFFPKFNQVLQQYHTSQFTLYFLFNVL
jgi:hypothetical protein